MQIFTQDAAVLDIGAFYLRISAFIYWAYIILFVAVAALQGLKRPLYAIWIGLYRQILAPAIVFYTLASLMGMGLTGIWWGIFLVALSTPNSWWTALSPLVIFAVLLKMTGIPLMSMQKDEADKLLKLEDELHKDVVSQDEAVRAVAGRSSTECHQGNLIFERIATHERRPCVAHLPGKAGLRRYVDKRRIVFRLIRSRLSPGRLSPGHLIRRRRTRCFNARVRWFRFCVPAAGTEHDRSDNRQNDRTDSETPDRLKPLVDNAPTNTKPHLL